MEELGLDDGEEGFYSTLPSEPDVEDVLDLEAKGEGGSDQVMLRPAGSVAWGVAEGLQLLADRQLKLERLRYTTKSVEWDTTLFREVRLSYFFTHLFRIQKRKNVLFISVALK